MIEWGRMLLSEMGCCCRPTSELLMEQKENDKKIRKSLKMDKKFLASTRKVLLLGAEETGKSTFIKQMRIIHGFGYSEEDRRDYAKYVYQNIFMNMQSIIRAMDHLKIEFVNSSNLNEAALINKVTAESLTTLENMQVKAIKNLWADSGVQQCYSRRSEYALNDSAKYFLENIDRIASPSYLPTEQDILRVRIPTTGVIEYFFTLNSLNLRVIDVGGQRTERKKWIRCFEDVTSIIFLAALSDYDLVSSTFQTETKMEISRALFATVIGYPWFVETSFILFLNKTDIFEEKIVNSSAHLVNYYPKFNGKKRDPISARNFILDLFLSSNLNEKTIYHHFTCVTDTENIRVVFTAVRDTILRENIKEYCLD